MQWENLTSLEFEKAAATCAGVGIIPIGVLEPHAAHLPLGTDAIMSHWIACRAAERETAVVFPFFPFGVNIESAHLPGSVSLKQELIFGLLENICDEMYRNGLNKIILHSGHGGNRYYLPLFVQMLPAKKKPYVVYYADLEHFPGAEEVLDGEEYGHACEAETSAMLYVAPDLVKMEILPPKPFTNRKRNENLSQVGAYTQMDWYAQYPHMYVGDAAPATAEKGKIMIDRAVENLIALIKVVKADDITPGLVKEFNERVDNPQSPPFWING